MEKKIDATEIITELGEKGGEKGEAEHRRGSRYTEKYMKDVKWHQNIKRSRVYFCVPLWKITKSNDINDKCQLN